MRTSALSLLLSLNFFTSAEAAITLLDAYQSAVTKTEPVAIQKSLASQADERVDQILGKVFPQFSLLGNYTYQQPTGTGGATSAFTRPDQYTVRLNVTQPIFHGFGEWAEMRSRKAARAAAELREQATRLTLYRNVSDAYYSVLAEETDCRNLEELIALTEKQVRELKQRVSIGRSRTGDLLAAEAKVASLRGQLLAQRNVLVTARETLRAVTGLGLEVELVPLSEKPAEPPPLDGLVAELENRPDFAAAKRDVEYADEQISVARAGHWPGLDATGNYYFTRTGVLASSKYDFGFQFVWPLFSGGTVEATVRENVEKRKSAELTLALLRRTAEQELRTAHAGALLAVGQEQQLAEGVKLSEKNYEVQLRDYRNGLVTNLDVLTALQSLAEARRGHDRLVHDARKLTVRVQVAAGHLPQS